ncbi:MAG: S53 family peptidase [Marmoricola sp.]
MRRHVTACTLIAASALTLGFVSASPSSAASGPHRIPGTSPGWLSHGKRVGTPSPNATVNVRLYLAPRGGLAALASASHAIATPGSASYHHFLTPAQYHARYDATSQSVSAVSSWLKSAGFKVTAQEAHNRYLDISGNVAAAQRAFGVTMGTYTHNGMTVQAPSGAASAPSAVASDVLALSGLDTTPMVASPSSQKPKPPSGGFRNATPCSHWYGDTTQANTPTPDGVVLPLFNNQAIPFSPCGYTGPQLRGAYEAGNTAGLDGTGVTVAIVDAFASPTILSDANTYATSVGDSAFSSGQFSQSMPGSFTQVNANKSPKQCDAAGWYGEETLDVEAVHAMAPGANVRYYAGASCNDTDLLAAFARINDEAKAQIVSNSWGGTGDVVKSSLLSVYDAAFMQGNMEGISYAFSTGDNGDEKTSLGSPQTDYPASDPHVTGVGGTSTEITQSGIQAETGWQTSKYVLNAAGTDWTQSDAFLYGGGGGYSSNFKEPDYQVNAHIPDTNGGRALPDVSMDADPTTGMLIGQTQTFPTGAQYDTFRIGGTSLACPLFVGMTALKIQASATGGAIHGLGELNPIIYADHSGFSDVTGAGVDPGNIRVDFVNGVDATGGYKYSVRTFNGATTSLSVGAGWDTETGWGSARAGWLAPAS